jgi:hypothetical protein
MFMFATLVKTIDQQRFPEIRKGTRTGAQIPSARTAASKTLIFNFDKLHAGHIGIPRLEGFVLEIPTTESVCMNVVYMVNFCYCMTANLRDPVRVVASNIANLVKPGEYWVASYFYLCTPMTRALVGRAKTNRVHILLVGSSWIPLPSVYPCFRDSVRGTCR